MAKRFVRVDLSDNARDFRPIAIEPGVPLLDRANANAKILHRWLGGLIAAPEWDGESVNFYVQDDLGGRLEEVSCQPVTNAELQTVLKDDVECIRQKLDAAKPETSTERAVRRIAAESYLKLTEDLRRSDLDNFFFRYRDAQGRLRLVWTCGYQRVDQAPGVPLVCGDQKCELLFIRRQGQNAKCPRCSALHAPRKKVVRRRGGRKYLLLLLLLLLAGGLGGYWYWTRDKLFTTPDNWAGTVGSRIDFAVRHPGILGFGAEDVSHEAVAVPEDPRIVQFEPHGPRAVARNAGTTRVHFYLGNRSSTATLTVAPAKMPAKLSIEPQTVELGVGTTAQLKLMGEYEDGTRADLTSVAQWVPKSDRVIYSRGGFVEGLSPGTGTLTARYRAGPKDKPLEATANVTVAKLNLQKVEIALAPAPLRAGRASRLSVEGVTDKEKRYSLTDSSLLDLRVEPPYLASVQGQFLVGQHPGTAKATAKFGKLAAELSVEIVDSRGVDTLVVGQDRLEMAVGEIADVSRASPWRDPVRITSSAPNIVEITRENRLVARSVGAAKVDVMQSGVARTVNVSVATANVQSVAIDPPYAVVAVDHTLPVRVTGRLSTGRDVELAPDVVEVERVPSPRYAEFNRRGRTLLGMWPTEKTASESLGVKYKTLTASAPVEVVAAPLRLELTPTGPVDLPLCQMASLDAWAQYGDGLRVQVFPERIKWQSKPSGKTLAGLELRGHKVAALKSGVGPMSVWGEYFAQESNRVALKSVERGKVDLRIDVDRTLRLVGEPGQAVLLGSGPKGDVELVPELAKFESSDAKTLAIDEASGGFRAAAPGEVTLNASHAGAAKPTSLGLQVVDTANAKLAFEPNAAKLGVDELVRMELNLEGKLGEKTHRAALSGPGVRYSVAKPDSLRWQMPQLVGLSPTTPLDLSAGYHPFVKQPAAAKVEVTAAKEPAGIRIVPKEVSVVPGQLWPLAVEEQLPGAQDWKEVRPDAVAWDVPGELIWIPATERLTPAVVIPPGATGSLMVSARYQGHDATATFNVAPPSLDPKDPAVKLVLQREPEGRYLPVGGQQRFSVVLRKDKAEQRAADLQWPPTFENEYVRWEAPVLTAKQGGYEQWLRAEVAGRVVRFQTLTIAPEPYEPEPPQSAPVEPEVKPVELRIVSDQGPAVRFGVGSQFDDFRIEARYPDGFTRIVTKKAAMNVPQAAAESPVSFSKGRIQGVRPGTTAVSAAYEGATTQSPLNVEVTANVDIDELRLVPAPVKILPGETVRLDAVGYKGGKSVGILSGLGGVDWRSDNQPVLRVDGPVASGVKVGVANVTAQLGGVTSKPAPVNVVDSIADSLVVDQPTLRMRVGESRQLGSDLIVSRGGADFSRQVRVSPALPGVVRFDPATSSLVAVAPGVSPVTFTWGDKLVTSMVEVVAGGKLEGRIVVEPASVILAPGQAVDLRVFVITDDGRRFDRTASAGFQSSDAKSVTMRGNLACALAPGDTTVRVVLPEREAKGGQATVTVNNEPITDVSAEPSRLDMAVGDQSRLRILGRAASGTYELFPQEKLKLTVAGQNPDAVRLDGSQQVSALTPGVAEVAADWDAKFNAKVPVSVTNQALRNLSIDPATATLHPGQGTTYQVTAMKGNQIRVLGPPDGVRMFTTDPEVARVSEGNFVTAANPGRIGVVAEVAGQRAEAALNVVPGSAPATIDSGDSRAVVYGPGGVVYGPDGEVIYGGGSRVIYGPDGRVVYDGGVDVVDRAVVAPPVAEVSGLRFVPDAVRLGANSPGANVQLFEVLADGSLGANVSNSPDLELNVVGTVASAAKTPEGVHVTPGGRAGATRIAAKLGTRFADPELLVQVGDLPLANARLIISPQPMDLWAGESGQFRVSVDPGDGLTPVPVDYRVTVPPESTAVGTEGERSVRGLVEGVGRVTLTTVDPRGPYDGLAASALVQVGRPDTLRMEPTELTLQVGQTTPPFVVMARTADGQSYRVPAVLDSADPNVLAPDPGGANQFTALALGGTQIRALYRGREVFANVTVAGERFQKVDAKLNESDEDFYVSLQVLAGSKEGPLEYRVYPAGQPPAEVWTPTQSSEDGQKVTVQSPRIRYGPRSARYSLILEARPAGGSGTAQKYPFTFRLVPNIEQTDLRQ